MKTARSLQFLHRRSRDRRRGSTLLEVILAMVVGSMTVVAMLWACGPFLVGEPAIQAALANQRMLIDEMGLTLRRDIPPSARCFTFEGTLQNADSTPYAGTRLNFASPVHELVGSGDFLAATGLTLIPAGGADTQTVVIVGESQTPVAFMTRSSAVRADGWTEIATEVTAGGISRNCRFAAPPTATVPELAAARGRVETTAAAVSLYLPNPLALPSARLGQVKTGALVVFPVLRSRTVP